MSATDCTARAHEHLEAAQADRPERPKIAFQGNHQRHHPVADPTVLPYVSRHSPRLRTRNAYKKRSIPVRPQAVARRPHNTTDPTFAIGYVRVSTAEQADSGLSLDIRARRDPQPL